MRLGLSALTSFAAFGIAACGGSDGPTQAMDYRIETSTPTLSVGQDSTVSVNATVINVTQDRALTSPVLAYRSSDFRIATVTTAGLVRGMSGGTTDIEVIFRDDTLRIPVTVRANPITALQIRFVALDAGTTISTDGLTARLGSGVGFSLSSGQRAEMAMIATDATGDRIISQRPTAFGLTNTTVAIQRRGIFSTTDPAVATVSNASSTLGRVTAVGVGTAKIIFAVPGDGGLADTVDVTVVRRAPTGVRVEIVDPTTLAPLTTHPLAIKKTGQLTLKGTPTASSPSGDMIDRRVTYRMAVGHENRASVDVLGVVRPTSAAVVGEPIVVEAVTVPLEGETARVGSISLIVTN